jgi:hypothetical protein
MMELSASERELAIATLNACGIEGSDAETSLDTLCHFAEAPSLQAWHAQHQGATPAALTTLYGSDAVRAAHVLQVHLPSASVGPS